MMSNFTTLFPGSLAPPEGERPWQRGCKLEGWEAQTKIKPSVGGWGGGGGGGMAFSVSADNDIDKDLLLLLLLLFCEHSYLLYYLLLL